MHKFGEIIADIKGQLRKPLPGLEVQKQMMPASRLNDILKVPDNVRKGAVLVLLYPKNENLTIIFIERSEDGGVHSGQIGFPGGKYEKSDNDLSVTALRETHEEVGVLPVQVDLLGRLSSLYVPVSNFLVTPYVGYASEVPNFIANPDEVAEIIEIPLIHLVNEKAKTEGEVNVMGRSFKVPVFKSGDRQIWGATAMMLNEFIFVVNRLNGKIKEVKD